MRPEQQHRDDARLAALCRDIPVGLDVLITHMPPLGVLDTSVRHGGVPRAAPIAIGSTVLGTTMVTEFQKPVRTPSHDTPVQASLQAVRQASSVGTAGQANRWPRRISSMLLNEVASMM